MLGFVGCGNMAQAMLKGILAKDLYKADEIIVSRRTKEALDALHEELGVQTTTDNKEVAEKADVIKAYVVGDELKEVEFYLGDLTDAEREIILKGCLINYYRG